MGIVIHYSKAKQSKLKQKIIIHLNKLLKALIREKNTNHTESDYGLGVISGVEFAIEYLKDHTDGELMVKYNDIHASYLNGVMKRNPYNRGFRNGLRASYEEVRKIMMS